MEVEEGGFVEKEEKEKVYTRRYKAPWCITAKAEKKGITSAQLQENVLSNPDDYDERTVKQARLRKTLVGLNKKKKDKKK
ncbi:MAG: hypothetical protein CM15mV80_930 [uncultured marine virus]|nr:MAG: hypothetical protein CM15mV80_930 [uncultured marine virus]